MDRILNKNDNNIEIINALFITFKMVLLLIKTSQLNIPWGSPWDSKTRLLLH